MHRKTFLDVGDFDLAFTCPGGGLVNHDFRNTVVLYPGIRPITLLGEGVFHR
jgi:hypothetical protein